MNEEFLTIKDDEGILRPMAKLWPAKLQDVYQPQIDEFLNHRQNKGCTLVKVKLVEIPF